MASASSVDASPSVPQQNTAPCGLFKPTGDNIDIAWQWNSLKDPNNRRFVTCDYCLQTTNGGITRAKRHQIGLRGDVQACRKIPADVKKILKDAYMLKQAEKDANMVDLDVNQDDDVEELVEIHNIKTGKRKRAGSDVSTPATKAVKGPLDLHFFKRPSIKLDKKQTSINNACDKEAMARTIQYIERFLCTNGLPFNVVRSRSFKLMIEAVGNYGPHLKPPSYHECRVPLLKKEMEYTKELLKDHEVQRATYGCSIMSDGWTDRKNRTLINFLVNCPSGTMFMKSVDASSYVKTGEKIFELLNTFVEEIGEKNVI
ncbi:uncharacterized protein LOC133318146 [Gastrolobium bilobum]|uniref:uncharacterized protein LOC133318146 n=1 Tax=Gastrolobium bilobum TaxID=150636 RepID=UPI002AB19FB7|nr:uncharacterized protein LOC133318146 [Gastrolobium bilobum]